MGARRVIGKAEVMAAMFLMPQRLPKEISVGTSVLVFTFVNWIKLPFFCVDRSLVDLPVFVAESLITPTSLLTSAKFFPLVPLGVWLGEWLNRRFSERVFVRVIYGILLVTGLQLICNFDRAAPFRCVGEYLDSPVLPG